MFGTVFQLISYQFTCHAISAVMNSGTSQTPEKPVKQISNLSMRSSTAGSVHSHNDVEVLDQSYLAGRSVKTDWPHPFITFIILRKLA